MPIFDNLFKQPNVPSIERDVERGQGNINISGYDQELKKLQDQTEKSRQELRDKIDSTLGLESVDSDVKKKVGIIINNSPFLKSMNAILNKLKNKATIIIAEATLLQEQVVNELNRSLIGAPVAIIEAINTLTGDEYVNTPEGNNQLSECHLACIARQAGAFGDNPDNTPIDRYNNMKDVDDTNVAMMEKETEKIGPKFTGLWLFMFMVRFILAYAVHITLDFLCCYFKDKTAKIIDRSWLGGKIKIRIVIEYGPKWISPPIGQLAVFLKGILGFRCRETSTEAEDCYGQGPIAESSFVMFKCCWNPRWDACTQETPDTVEGIKMPDLGKCVQKMMIRVNDELTGDGDGRYTCDNTDCAPQNWTAGNEEKAKTALDYIEANSTASNTDGTNTYYQGVTDPSTMSTTTNILKNTNQQKDVIETTQGTLNESVEYDITYKVQNGYKCAALSIDPKGVMGKSWGDLTKDDIMKAISDNVDLDFTDELAEYDANDVNTYEVDPNIPPEIEPLKTIWETIHNLDDTLGSVMDEFRKTIAAGKMINGLLTNKDFCCVIYYIVVLGNLARYKTLCPDNDLEDIFRYAQDFGNSNAIKEIENMIKGLKKLIAALNADILAELNIMGFGLPLGTMLEMLKEGIAAAIMTLVAIAFGPLDKALTELENEPKLKNIMDNQCFGIGDLFGMIKCGLSWIYDMIKQWASQLIPYKLQNIEILPNIRMGQFRSSFLKQLELLLDQILELLQNIGDCYGPEKIAEEALKILPDEPVVKAVKVMPPSEIKFNGDGSVIAQRINISSKSIVDASITYEDIGSRVIDSEGNEVFPDDREVVYNEYLADVRNPQGKIFPVGIEAYKIGFLNMIRNRNGMDLPKISDIQDLTDNNKIEEVISNIIEKQRSLILTDEQRMKKVFDMIEILKEMK